MWQYLAIDPTRTPHTSYTIGIDEPEKTLAKLVAARDFHIIKVKLGSGRDIEIIEAIKSRFSGTLR